MLRRLGLAVALSLAAATSALAQSQEDWAAFEEASYSAYRDDDEPPDWETVLWTALGDAPGRPDLAVTALARHAGISIAEAERFAAVIVEAVLARDDCAEPSACTLAPGSRRYEAVVAAAAAEPTGELLWAVGANQRSHDGGESLGGFLQIVMGHPARVMVLGRLSDYAEALPYAAALVSLAPRDPETLTSLGSNLGSGGGVDQWSGWLEAILETALADLERQDAPAQERAVYTQALLQRYFMLGLTDRALVLYLSSPEAVRELLPLSVSGCEAGGRCQLEVYSAEIGDELAAVLWQAGRHDEARAVIARTESRVDVVGVPRHAAILDAMAAERPPAALFALFTKGESAPEGRDEHAGLDGRGWMFADLGPGARRLVADRARAAGYPAIADFMAERPLYYRGNRGGGALALMAVALSDEVKARHAVLAPEIEAAWSASAPAGSGRVATERPAAAVPGIWSEAALPEGLLPWRDAGGDGVRGQATPDLPAGVDAPVSEYALLRHEQIGEEHVVLFRSSEFDLPGEIPAFGVWMMRTEGGRWTDPVYLGLQEHFPYVVTPGSALPLIADGWLQIEVQAREIDPASITFPPVGLAFAREEDGLVVRVRLEDLLRDTDGDTLTDLAEERLGLRPDARDTDGDGIGDGRDPFPLTAFDPDAPTARKALAHAILEAVFGHEAGAVMVAPMVDGGGGPEALLAGAVGGVRPDERLSTVILVADPDLFAGVVAPFRLMVYTPEQIARLTEGGAPFYPPQVRIFSSLDGQDHLVIWDASWVGGRFTAHCPPEAAACEVEVLSAWIT